MEDIARTKWGRATIGGGRVPAMAIAVPAGILLAVAIGVAVALVGDGDPFLVGVVFAACLAVPCVLLFYVLLVDRRTLDGAADRPEDSVESRWYERAAAGALTDVLIAAGIGVVVMLLIGAEEGAYALAGVIAVSFLSFAVRYAVLRRRG